MRYLVPCVVELRQSATMSFRVLLCCCLCSLGFGYHSKRQLDSFNWYDQVVLPASTSEMLRQIQDRPLFFVPQYQEQEQYRRMEPEQVATLPRVYPVLIQFWSPVPLEQPQNLEPGHHPSFEPGSDYHRQDSPKERNDERRRDDSNTENVTEPLQSDKVATTRRPSLKSFTITTRTSKVTDEN